MPTLGRRTACWSGPLARIRSPRPLNMGVRLTMRANRMLFAGVAVALLLSFWGCIFHPSYLQSWALRPAVADGNTCPDVSGLFSDKGDRAHEISGARAPSLTSLLFRKDQAVESPTHIEIRSVGTDTWRVTAISNGVSLAARDVTAQGPCRGGELKLADPNEEGGVNREGVIGFVSSALYLSRASDRSLIVRLASGGTAIVLLAPVVGSEWVWFRFRGED